MTDFHADYHQPSDEAKLINYEKLDLITKVIYEMARYHANAEARPVLQKPDWLILPD
jgi:hypothetical protein